MKARTKKKTIKVTQKEINNGLCNSNTGCPIALAFRASGIEAVIYYNGFVYINKKGRLSSIKRLPKEAQEFIYNFDQKRSVKPFKFRVTL